jgi:hypothetical protein
MAFVFTCLNAEQVILSFLDNMPNRSYPLAGASWAFIRRAICREADSNVKPRCVNPALMRRNLPWFAMRWLA